MLSPVGPSSNTAMSDMITVPLCVSGCGKPSTLAYSAASALTSLVTT
jgi:hypothetical protein